MKDKFHEAYGDIFASADVAPRIYQQGWNDALAEAARRVNELPFGDDTKASFAVYFTQMMEQMDERNRNTGQENQ